jgi:hypothetical protein
LVNRLSKPYFQVWRSIKTRELQRHIYIAITGCLGKLLNSILNNRLDGFLLKNNIISPDQIGFTTKSRPADHIFVLKTSIDKYIYKRKKIYTCFIDLKKAFDSVMHEAIYIFHFMKFLKTCIANQSLMLKLGIFSQITSPPKLGLDRLVI